MTPSDSPYARCFDLCGNVNAALVLERLSYWWSRGTRVLKGVEWRAKPRDQLARECRLTEWQCRKGLEILKAKCLVETSQHLFGSHVGPVMHYRLLPRALVLFEKAPSVQNEPENEGSVLVENHQLLDHNGGIRSNSPYGISNEIPSEELARLIHRTMAVGRFWSDGERDRASVLTPMALDCSVGA